MTLVDAADRVRAVAAVLLTVVLGAALVPVLAGPAHACSCAADFTDAQAYEGADSVFVGQVESVREPAGFPFGMVSSGDPVTATIVVDTVYKGAAYQRTPVITPRDGASCGVEFVEGAEYAVFATYGSDGPLEAADDELTAAMCSGTRPLAERPLDLAVSGSPPLAGSPAAQTGFPMLGWLSFAAVAMLGLMPVALWIRFSRGTSSTGPGSASARSGSPG